MQYAICDPIRSCRGAHLLQGESCCVLARSLGAPWLQALALNRGLAHEGGATRSTDTLRNPDYPAGGQSRCAAIRSDSLRINCMSTVLWFPELGA